jgi:hypothetical protein
MIKKIKMKPFIISKCIASRCFREVKNLPIKHASNTSAWMTASVSEGYLCNGDRQLAPKSVLVIGQVHSSFKLELAVYRIRILTS